MPELTHSAMFSAFTTGLVVFALDHELHVHLAQVCETQFTLTWASASACAAFASTPGMLMLEPMAHTMALRLDTFTTWYVSSQLGHPFLGWPGYATPRWAVGLALVALRM